jgi:hypothetical protein
LLEDRLLISPPEGRFHGDLHSCNTNEFDDVSNEFHKPISSYSLLLKVFSLKVECWVCNWILILLPVNKERVCFASSGCVDLAADRSSLWRIQLEERPKKGVIYIKA